MPWALYPAARCLSKEQIEHHLNSRDLSKKGLPPASVGVRYADRKQGDRSVCPIKTSFAMENHSIEGPLCLPLKVVLYRRSSAPSGRVDFVLRKIADAVRHYGRSGVQCREASGGAQNRVDRGLVTHGIVF